MRFGIYIGDIQKEEMGGASSFQSSLLKALLKTKTIHQIYIFYHSSSDIAFPSSNISFVNIKFKRRFLQKKSKIRDKIFNEKILENKIELLWFLVPSYYNIEIPFILTVWDLAHRKTPFFPELSISGWSFDQREEFYNRAIKRASFIITGNEVGAREIERFYNFPYELIKKIPFPTPSFALEKEFDDTILAQNNLQKNRYIFYPAQFWPHKNHIRIIKAFALLKNSDIDLKVVFVGSDKGNKQYIQEKVKEYNLENEVKFLGFVSRQQLSSLYNNSFALVYASMIGPNNLPPLEAMAFDCPVICADAPGMKDQLGECAIFFESSNENDLVRQIKNLYYDNSAREVMVNKARDFSSCLTPDKYILDVIKIVDEFSPIRECWSGEVKYVHS